MQCVSVLAAAAALFFTQVAWAQGEFLEQEEQESDAVSTVGKGRLNALRLNSRTFGGNVLRREEPIAEHWIVLFCYSWYPPCQAFQVPYMGFAEKYSEALNNDTLFSNFVRFAAVDCAIDKVLCNEQEVEGYPTVSHYAAGELRSQWTGGDVEKDAKRVRQWLDKEIVSSKNTSRQQKPFLTKQERASALRILFALAACISSFVWAVGRGADIWLILRERRASKPKAAVEKEEEKPQPPESSLARRLPEEWASGRGSMEL